MAWQRATAGLTLTIIYNTQGFHLRTKPRSILPLIKFDKFCQERERSELCLSIILFCRRRENFGPYSQHQEWERNRLIHSFI